MPAKDWRPATSDALRVPGRLWVCTQCVSGNKHPSSSKKPCPPRPSENLTLLSGQKPLHVGLCCVELGTTRPGCNGLGLRLSVQVESPRFNPGEGEQQSRSSTPIEHLSIASTQLFAAQQLICWSDAEPANAFSPFPVRPHWLQPSLHGAVRVIHT